jgi:8-oxo-dGTP pyrophosphatase MutT (NUDIX family)
LVFDKMDSFLHSARTSGIPRPVDAVTVIIVREGGGTPFEVFLMRRHRDQHFMGGAYVFPGGRLEETDCDPSLMEWTTGLTAEEAKAKLNEPDLPGERAVGLFLAAVRETFEEAGVLLAASSRGEMIGLTDAETQSRFRAHRRKLHCGEISLKGLAEGEGLRFMLGLLTPFSHWITPEVEIRRFDTRFLVARMPEGQSPAHDSVETVESLWVTPREAIAKNDSGEILLMPPTLKTLDELCQFRSLDEIFHKASQQEINPILPQPFKSGDAFGVKLPHDPEYSIMAYKRWASSEEPSRIVFGNGVWRLSRFHQETP